MPDGGLHPGADTIDFAFMSVYDAARERMSKTLNRSATAGVPVAALYRSTNGTEFEH